VGIPAQRWGGTWKKGNRGTWNLPGPWEKGGGYLPGGVPILRTEIRGDPRLAKKGESRGDSSKKVKKRKIEGQKAQINLSKGNPFFEGGNQRRKGGGRCQEKGYYLPSGWPGTVLTL